MKRTLLILLFTISSFSLYAQDINWLSLDDALAKQKRVAKPIFLNVYTDWHTPCKMMDKGTFQDADVAEYINRNYYAVKFNAEGNSRINYMGNSFDNPNYDPERKGRNSTHELTKYLKVPSYLTLYILDTRGNIKEVIEGAKDPTELLRILKN
ncbi:thioredoxin family protein [Flavobacterium columnare]|uniref:thioredoxin family protein n=1 Tax=Flavobacterium columnare TaxID=996 RepID=UPI0040337E73